MPKIMQQLTIMMLLILIAFGQQISVAQVDDKVRENIAEQYKWNLSDLYPTQNDWEREKEATSKKFAKIGDFKGKLANSAQDLKEALDYFFQVRKEFYRLFVYAFMLSDQDTREAGPLAMKQEMNQINTNLTKMASFVEPEILKIPKNKLDSFFSEEPGLKQYAQFIDDIQRRKAHTLNNEEEALVAEAGRMAGSAQNIFTVFSNADLPRPTITLSDGHEARLDAAGYTANRATKVREDRLKVFESFFGALKRFERTFGTQLNAEVQKNIFNKNVRKYDSSLESSLNVNNIPVSVYHKLIENTNNNLSTLHRYLKLRKRMLGVDELYYYDMYPSLVKAVDLKYTYDEAADIVKEALKVLGNEYVATVDRAFKERWLDVYPTTGKRSGAYSSGSAYDVHPYILLNYNGQYDDMRTLAHELGHTMHSYFSNKHQLYVNAGYPIFLAEVASTANEALLTDYELKRLKDPEKRLSLLGDYLENFRQTMFRQTQFAEFELKIHELAENGEALTGEKFTNIYLDILKKYYGHDQGITVIEDLYGIEWAYIPHFYYNFYVFQYSTSYLASQVLAEKMLSGDAGMIKKYLNFLSNGRSEYAIPTLKKVGIDMTTDDPFNLAMKKMNKIMDEMEKLLTQIKN
jgi:oligoendopeptidase F